MNNFIKTLIIVTFLTSVISAGCYSSSSEKTTDILFINGVFAKLERVIETRDDLKKLYQTELELKYPEEAYNFTYGYNRSECLTGDFCFQDLHEATVQKLVEHADIDMAMAEEIVSIWELEGYEAVTFKNVQSKSVFHEVIANVATHMAVVDEDVDEIAYKVAGSLLSGHRIILYAHSQGTLFAKDVFGKIAVNYADRNLIKSISTINIAATTDDAEFYVTAPDDKIVNGFREIFPSILKGSIKSNKSTDPDYKREWTNHRLFKSYLHPSLPSRKIIDDRLFFLAETLPFPEVYIGEGALRVTLVWGDEPDVDLHVMEPNGAHVYYANRNGQDGVLDVDDVDGQGPENYFVPCESINEGLYQVKILFYRGKAPENTTISITDAYGNNKLINVLLYQDGNGSSNWNSGYPVANVHVLKDESTGVMLYKVDDLGI